MNMLDSTLDFFLRGFKVRSKQLQQDQALAAAKDFSHWYAVELIYKNQPIRLIVAASQVPDDFAHQSRGAVQPGGPDQGALQP